MEEKKEEDVIKEEMRGGGERGRKGVGARGGCAGRGGHKRTRQFEGNSGKNRSLSFEGQ